MGWRYFGRTGGGGTVYDVYRLPSERYDGKLDFPHFRIMERLLSDGGWIGGQNDRVEKDWVDGWLDEDDEISFDAVQALIEKWKAEGWPGSKKR